MRELEQYVRGSQLPEPKPKRPALLRPSAVPARTASGGLGSARGEAQTPFRPVAQVAGVRQERYLNGAGRVAIDPSLISYVSYVATTGNVAVLDVALPLEQLPQELPQELPQSRFFRFASDVGRAGSDATPIATFELPTIEQELAVWELQSTNSNRLNGILRTERYLVITFCIGAGSDKQTSSFNSEYGQQTLSPSNRSFIFPRRDAPNVLTISMTLGNVNGQVNPNNNKTEFEQALLDAGVIAENFGYALLIGCAYDVRQKWLGPAGYVRDSDTGAFVAVADGEVINEAVSDGVADDPETSASIRYRAF